eukprot:scpid27200/ scgid1222/ Anoctamin-7; New gene expressed in prostate homolog; Transmembrane protein 16G
MPPRKKAYKLVPKGETESSGSEGESTATRVLRWVTAGRYGRRERSESTEAQLAAADKDIHPEVVREVYRKAATAGQEEWMLWHSEKEIDADQEPLWRRRWKMSRQRRFDPGNQEAGVQYLPLSGDPIDFVLAWESGLHDDVEDDEEEERERANARGHFQARLRSEGLVTHVEPSINNPRLKFVLLHAPFGVLLRVAESLHLKMPIARYSQGEMNLSEKVLQKLGVRNPMLTSACEGSQRPFYRAAPVKVNTLNSFLGSFNTKTFFRPSQRSSIVSHILDRTKYSSEPGALGISQLLDNRSYTAAFPLHQGKADLAESMDMINWDTKNTCPREELAVTWATFSCWYKYQPLHTIRDYFGERVAFYFTWLGYYTMSLIPPAIVGFITFIYGLATIVADPTILTICHSAHVMCPTCAHCKFWKLSDICLSVKSAHVFDNEATLLYGLFLCLWASVFLELWKRKAAVTARQWNCDAHEEEEPVRAEYAAKAKEVAPNVITGELEPHLQQQKWPLYISAYMMVALLFCVVAIWLLTLIVYHTAIAHISGEPYRSLASPVANVTASIINLLLILFTRRVFSLVAVKLTEFENHRTESEFSNHLAFKLFIFDCANLFALPVYVAFFKGRFGGYPNHFKRGILPYHGQQCGAFGCVLELAETVGIVLFGKLILDKALDMLSWCWARSSFCCLKGRPGNGNNNKNRKPESHDLCDAELGDDVGDGLEDTTTHLPQWESDYKLTRPKPLHWQYLEMVMQFGLITIFGVAFPLAPLIALVNNVIEIRLDAMNYVKHTCRIVANIAQNIGIWFTLLDLLTKVAVVTTALILTFTSNGVAKLLYRVQHGHLSGFVGHSLSEALVFDPALHRNVTCKYVDLRSADGNLTAEFWFLVTARLVFVMIFEHVVFLAMTILDWAVPDVPQALQDELAREIFQAKKVVETANWQSGTSTVASQPVGQRRRRKSTKRKTMRRKPTVSRRTQ